MTNYPESLIPIYAGVLGTLAMTLFTEFTFRIMKKPYHVIRILGNMLPFNSETPLETRPSKAMLTFAGIIHFAIGIVFSYLFAGLVTWDVISPTLGPAALFGALIGTVAVIGWRLFFYLHPGPPPVNLRYYLRVIWIGHVMFSLVQYYALTQYADSIELSMIP